MHPAPVQGAGPGRAGQRCLQPDRGPRHRLGGRRHLGTLQGPAALLGTSTRSRLRGAQHVPHLAARPPPHEPEAPRAAGSGERVGRGRGSGRGRGRDAPVLQLSAQHFQPAPGAAGLLSPRLLSPNQRGMRSSGRGEQTPGLGSPWGRGRAKGPISGAAAGAGAEGW